MRLGRSAAAAMLASRVGDGYGDPAVQYALPPAIGTWQPTSPATDMLAAWLGSLRPLVLTEPVTTNGPDELTSADYTADFIEVESLGSEDSTVRTQPQTDTALFFNSNSATMVGDATVRYLEAHPVGLRRTAAALRRHARLHDRLGDPLLAAEA